MNIDEILESGAFSGLSPEQKASYRSLAGKLAGKSVSEGMPLVMAFMASMPKAQIQSPEQQQAMSEAIMSGMSAEDRAKFKSLIKMAEQMRK